jgi:hypothetical protein
MIHYDFPLEPEKANALIAKLNSEGNDVLCIFGCGIFGKGDAYNFLAEKLGLKISFFCDNNPNLLGQKLTGDSIEVIAPAELQKQAKKAICFCCLSIEHQNDVLEQLEQMQVAHIVPLTPLIDSPYAPIYHSIPSFFNNKKCQIILNMVGGLGNQLWIYSLYIALKKRYPHRDIKIDDSFYEIDYPGEFNHKKCNHGYKYALPHFFGINDIPVSQRKFEYETECKITRVQYFKTYFGTRTSPTLDSENIGIFFLPKLDIFIKTTPLVNICYMERAKVKEQVKQTLNSKLKERTVLSECDKKILYEIENTNSVFIHVRREDALRSKKIAMAFDVARMDFYKSAMEVIGQKVKNPKYFIFTSSDGLDYCKENFSFIKDAVFVAHDSKDVNIDLLLMSKCKHSIFSFSSFAWWAAFLNDHSEKIVVAGKYMNNGFVCQKMPYLPHWTVIDNLEYCFKETGETIE